MRIIQSSNRSRWKGSDHHTYNPQSEGFTTFGQWDRISNLAIYRLGGCFFSASCIMPAIFFAEHFDPFGRHQQFIQHICLIDEESGEIQWVDLRDNYRKPWIFQWHMGVSCNFSLKPTNWEISFSFHLGTFETLEKTIGSSPPNFEGYLIPSFRETTTQTLKL